MSTHTSREKIEKICRKYEKTIVTDKIFDKYGGGKKAQEAFYNDLLALIDEAKATERTSLLGEVREKVIGKDEEENTHYIALDRANSARNDLRAEQRKALEDVSNTLTVMKEEGSK